MLLLGGRSKVKKKRKFCLAVLGLVVMLVVSILPENMQTVYASECNNAYQFYNSYGNKPVFYNMNETRNYDYYSEDGYEMTIDSFMEFNQEHYFVCPQGYLKNPEYDKKILKKYGVA